MKKRNAKKVYKVNFKKIMLLVFLASLICLIIHPIQLFKNNIFKPISVAAGANESRPNRYFQGESVINTYVDASGKEYNVQFDQNLPEEILLSYEDIISHKAKIANTNEENKDLLIAEMKLIPNLNFEKRYRNQHEWVQEIPTDVVEKSKNDSTITQNENSRLAAIWQALGLGKYIEIYNEEKIIINSKALFEEGQIFAKTRTLALYKRNPTIQTVENGGVQSGEAYLMASNRNQSIGLDVDKIQQALWLINGEVSDINNIPKEYLGINPEANIVGDNVASEAKALNDYTKELKEFKKSHLVDGVETEIYDNMLKQYDKKSKTNYYENGMAGLVAYDEATKEFVIGPFSVDYIRSVYVPQEGGQNENQNEEGTIIFNSITDAELYGLNSNGQEVKLTDWNFVYPDVEYDLKAQKAVRIAETNAIKKGDKSPNIYPYPNENFYISFKDDSIDVITKLEFTTNNMNAEAEVYLYEGKYYDVSWKAVNEGSRSYLQMTPTWKDIRAGKVTGIDSADVYQIKSSRIIMEEKTMQLSLGKFHEKYSNYCIPLTMEFAGNVWYDGKEKEQVQNPNKVFGIRDKDENGNYIENGIPDVYVHLYDENGNEYDENGNRVEADYKGIPTDKNGYYNFKYVKIGPKYYIEFEYDGMKYKATTYLNGDADNSGYKSSDQFLNYLDYSHAKEDVNERIEYNNSFTEIKNGTTRTSGQAVSNTGTIKDISYTIKNFDDNYIGGIADINRYNISTRTKTTDLMYPLQNSYVITSKDISEVDQNQNYLNQLGVKNIFVLGRINLAKNQNYVVNTKQGDSNNEILVKDNFETEATINYTMVDEYLHHINLGLIERAPIDLAVKMDLIQSNFTLLNEVSDANIVDFGKRRKDIDSFDITSRSNINNEKYFEENYSQEIEYNEYITRHDFTDNPNSMANDNLQLFVQYKMTIRNQSEVTSGCVTELANYYDDDLYYPVDNNEIWRYYDKETNYVFDWENNGRKGYGNITIPELITYSSWAIKNGTEKKEELGQVKWNSNSKFGPNNNKNIANTGLKAMYTDSLKDVILEPGETIDIYIIYKVELKENSSIENGYGLYISNDNSGGGKKNIVEINSYKSFNVLDGSNGGRVDKDSAAGNIEIGNYISYEDNADEAPYLRVLVNGKTRGKSIVGYVWEDEADKTISTGGYTIRLGEDYFENYDNNQRRGNGKIDINDMTNTSFENYINNVMVELIRLEYNQSTGQYEQVEFTENYKKAYPEKYNQVYPQTSGALAGDTTQILTWTGPYSGGNDAGRPLNSGQYRFDNLIEGGKYKVRFTYGTEKELRNEITSDNVYSGHDYKSTKYNGRIDVGSIAEPSTEITFVIDSYELNNSGEESAIINLLKNLNSSLKNTNKNFKFNIYSFGKEKYTKCANFDELKNGSNPDKAFPAYEAIYAAGLELKSSSAKNKIMIIYNDGNDSQLEDTRAQIENLLKEGVTVVGIGNDKESLELYKVESNGQKVKPYDLNKISEDTIYNIIINQLIESYYLLDNISHAEDYLQNTSYYTMQGNLKTVTGRLEVMKYSQNMTPETADTLNIEYMKTLDQDLSEDSELSNAIKKHANYTQMTADSYEISMDFSDKSDIEKILNLGLQEIPERNIEVTNQVDNIVVKLANGRKIIDMNMGLNQNVQEIKDKLFNIYMDEEIMQGATIEVTYRINISNIGDVDTLYSYVEYATEEEKRNWYTALTGESVPNGVDINEILLKSETVKISKLYSYYDNLIFRAEDNNKWEIINKTVETDDALNARRDPLTNHLVYLNEDNLYDSRVNIRDERVVWNKVKDLEVLDRNEERINKYPVVETTSLKDIELYPNKSKEVIDNLNSNSSSRPVSTLCTYLVLSKTLSAKDMEAKDALNYKNYVEIISTSSNTGRRDYNGAEGNFTGDATLDANKLVSENDIDDAERIIILTPFGDKKIMIGLIISVLLILGIGIIFIKKKIL